MVDDEAIARESLARILQAVGYSCTTAASAQEALRQLACRDFAVVVTNVVLPGMGGMDLLAEISARFGGIDTVLVGEPGMIDLAVEAMKMGARDFLARPFPPGKLVETVSCLVRSRFGPGPGDRFAVGDGSEIIGRSPFARRMCETVRRLRGNTANVLICGRTGSGKDLVARAIHFGSERRSGPFIAVNCAGVPRSLAESHFFGHVRGAYTGAAGPFQGYFAAANGGTLFLDEVTEVSLDFQAVLLRAIEERQVTPVGAAVPEPIDARVIAATSRDCRQAVREGLLREDLYYRLAVTGVVVPSLRERSEDIPLLANHFLSLHARQFGCPPKRISGSAMERLKSHGWPGNVRELSNAIERAFALGTGPMIGVEDLALLEMGEGIDGIGPVPRLDQQLGAAMSGHPWPADARECASRIERPAASGFTHPLSGSPPQARGGMSWVGAGGMSCADLGTLRTIPPAGGQGCAPSCLSAGGGLAGANQAGPSEATPAAKGASPGEGEDGGVSAADGVVTLRLGECSLEEAEHAVIERALEETGGNKNKAARLLGISRATLYRKLAKFGWRNAGQRDTGAKND